MKIKIKSIWWNLTIFAGQWNNTTIGNTIYVQRNWNELPGYIQSQILVHEKEHIRQQKEVGLILFIFLYLFCLPLFFNPWRFKWEFEAYKKEGRPIQDILSELTSWRYGWLIPQKR